MAVVLLLYRPLLLSSTLPDVAEARGVGPRRMEIAFLLVVAAATTVTLPVVGALLIFSLMIGPPAAARAFVDRPGPAIALSVVLAVLTAWAAIASSYQTNWPVGFYVGVYSAAVLRRGPRLAWRSADSGRPAERRAAAAAAGSAGAGR